MTTEAHGPGPDDRSGVADAWHVSTGWCRYDPDTGEILEAGEMSLGAVRHRRAGGEHLIPIYGDPRLHRVDLVTLNVVPKGA